MARKRKVRVQCKQCDKRTTRQCGVCLACLLGEFGEAAPRVTFSVAERGSRWWQARLAYLAGRADQRLPLFVGKFPVEAIPPGMEMSDVA